MDKVEKIINLICILKDFKFVSKVNLMIENKLLSFKYIRFDWCK